MLFDSCGNGKDVRVENDVFRREPNLFCESLVRPRADLDLTLDGVSLSLFIKRHDNHGGAVPSNHLRLSYKGLFTLFEADRVYDTFAL